MALTPVEIRHMTPSTGFMGYNRAQTDRLLEDIAASFEDVWRERADLADKVEQLESDLVRFKELETLLRTVRELASGRVICVFGCGGDRDREKRPQMGRIASELADVVIVTNDNPRSEDPQAIIDAIVAGAVGAVEVEPDRAVAIARAIELAHDGDVVVIAGKGAEQGQEFADRTVPFDDRESARDALRTLGART